MLILKTTCFLEEISLFEIIVYKRSNRNSYSSCIKHLLEIKITELFTQKFLKDPLSFLAQVRPPDITDMYSLPY